MFFRVRPRAMVAVVALFVSAPAAPLAAAPAAAPAEGAAEAEVLGKMVEMNKKALAAHLAARDVPAELSGPLVVASWARTAATLVSRLGADGVVIAERGTENVGRGRDALGVGPGDDPGRRSVALPEGCDQPAALADASGGLTLLI